MLVIDDPENRHASMLAATRESLRKLPQKRPILEDLIARYGIHTPIDTPFIEDLLLLSEQHLLTTAEERDEVFQQHEAEMVKKAHDALNLRRLSQRMEAEDEQEHSVEISNARTFKFFLSEDGKQVRMDIPKVKDPDKEPARLGPNAVVEILGAQLTAGDYDEIAQTLLSLPGEAGQIMRAYFQSVDTWAQLLDAGLPSEKARQSRMMRSIAVRKAVGGIDDPKVSPFCDIPLNAIFLKARTKYPIFNLERLPQPFES